MELKIKDWDIALHKYNIANMKQPFSWGIRDCTIYTISCIEVMIGREVVKPKFTYTNEEEAKEFAKTWSLERGMVEQLGAFYIQPNFQRIGDIIIVSEKGFECSHVCLGRKSISCFPGLGVRLFHTGIFDLDSAKILRFN